MKNIKLANKLCIGSANFGDHYGLNDAKIPSKVTLKKIFSFIKKKNINFIDTSIAYRNSEVKIGKLKKNNLKIITKISNFPNSPKNIEKWIINKVYLSCKKLKVKNLYGLLIHHTRDLKDKKRSQIIYKTFDYLIKKKIVKKIGLSIYDPEELDLYVNEYNFKIIQAPINIFDRRIINSGWLKKLKDKNVEIFARSIFLQGLLLKDSKKIILKFPKWKKKILFFEKWVNKRKITKLEACIRFVNNLRGIDRIILGIRNEEQLQNNYNFLEKKKLSIPKYLNINSGNIINPIK